jgi:putative hemolysin
MRRLIALMVLTPGLFYVALVGAQSGEHGSMDKGQMKHEKAQAQEKITLIGQVIDPVCYIRHDLRGADHNPCAVYCARQGITLGILEDETGKIYLAFPKEHGDPNERLLGLEEEHVKVTGTVYHKGGLSGVVIDKIEKAKKEWSVAE